MGSPGNHSVAPPRGLTAYLRMEMERLRLIQWCVGKYLKSALEVGKEAPVYSFCQFHGMDSPSMIMLICQHDSLEHGVGKRGAWLALPTWSASAPWILPVDVI